MYLELQILFRVMIALISTKTLSMNRLRENLKSSGADIRLTIETQDIFTHPSESFLIIEGELKKNDNNRYGDNDPVSLTNNGMMHLFKRIRYDLSGQEIESLLHPGQATTMLGLLKYPDDFSKSKGLNQLWYKDTTSTAVLADNVGFKIRHDNLINTITLLTTPDQGDHLVLEFR